MTDYYQKYMKALQLAGMSERTQECYTRSIRKLVDFYDKTPDRISEQELDDYFLHKRNVDQRAPGTLLIAYSGVKFSGFPKVRHYGFIHPCYKIPIQDIRTMVYQQSHTEGQKTETFTGMSKPDSFTVLVVEVY